MVNSPITVSNLKADENTPNARNTSVNQSASFVSFTDKNSYDFPMQRRGVEYKTETRTYSSQSQNAYSSEKKLEN